ncbi:UNVERIFIED_CONTAM: hypothetical protein FKN15_059714 [Acipenser sinensis]
MSVSRPTPFFDNSSLGMVPGTVDTPSLRERIQARPNPEQVCIEGTKFSSCSSVVAATIIPNPPWTSPRPPPGPPTTNTFDEPGKEQGKENVSQETQSELFKKTMANENAILGTEISSSDGIETEELKDINIKNASLEVKHSESPVVTEETTFLNECDQESDQGCSKGCRRLKNACPPKGTLANIITKVTMAALLFGVVWSITAKECEPGGNLFSILLLLLCAVVGGKLVGLIKFPTLPPLPSLLGSTLYSIFRGVIEVVGGMVAGVALGFFIRYFPSKDQESLVMKRAYLLLGLSVFAVFGSAAAGFSGSGGLCTLVLAFLAGIGWGSSKGAVEDIVGVAWDIFQPLLFGLIGAEISVTSLNPSTVGLGVATLSIALVIRIVFTFVMVLFAGFNVKEKLFVSLAWVPKATVQAAIGSVALDTAREKQNVLLEKYGMDVLTVAFLAILITAPMGALIIGLAGPRLLRKPNPDQLENEGMGQYYG